MKSKSALFVALLLACAFLTSTAQAALLRVIEIKSDDIAAYVKEVERGQALLKKLGSTAVIRVWRARFAGDEAGEIMVCIEYADLAAYGAEDKKLSADADYQAWLKGLAKVRRIESDSLYEEQKP
jgi:hypothetical protein